jgi:leucyl aminopeptidase
MSQSQNAAELPTSEAVFAAPGDTAQTVPIHLVAGEEALGAIPGLDDSQQRWVAANRFTGKPREHLIVPAPDGSVAAVLYGIGVGDNGQPCGPSEWLAGDLPGKLPPATYAIETFADGAAAIAWGLGSYAFRRYKNEAGDRPAGPRLALRDDASARRARVVTDAVWLGRDLINTPANDLGPAELEAYARALATREDAQCRVVAGDDLLAENFPLIHAVGRASTRPPRLIEMRWGRQDAPAITLIGKGICFDTGGLDLKPASAMLLMKKDMGGAASALALAAMVMGLGLDIRLRVLIAAAENSVSGNAFRPGDVLTSRAGISVEIGNTDAEGRLVLADALALADEEKPALIASFATLTGAARVALGPDLPAMFATDDRIAEAVAAHGLELADPVWRMPFWPGYDRNLESPVADMNNISGGPFAGAVTAALFLKRFVTRADTYLHFDLYGWRPEMQALGPKGGEPHVARAMLAFLESLSGAT